MKFLLTKSNALSIFIISLAFFVVLISLRDYNHGTVITPEHVDTRINNYLIFATSSEVLREGGDLYALHPNLHYDYYKYSPTFAFLFSPISALPTWLGLVVWNLLNMVILILALKQLKHLKDKQILIVLLVAFLELVGSIMNEQSNGLMAGLMLLSFAFLENNKAFWGIAMLSISVYIKLFSLPFFVILLFYPKFKTNVLYSLIWLIFLAILPIVTTGLNQLEFLYGSWQGLLSSDHSESFGFSFMGILNSWFGWEPNKFLLVIIGLILTLIPLIKISQYKDPKFRYLYTSLLLIWMVVFNHKAESPTFVIAMIGVGLWYVISKRNRTNNFLLAFSLLFVSIAFSDLMPRDIREQVFYAYSLKALPVVILWAWILIELMKPLSEKQASIT